MKKRKDRSLWIIGIIVILIICIAATLDRQNNEGNDLPRAHYGDGAPTGGKGLQLVLQRLNYTPKVVYEPQRSVPEDAKVWMILDPETSFSSSEANQLLDWVKKGGLLIFCSDAENDSFSFNFSQSQPVASGPNTLRTALGIDPRNYGNSLQRRPPVQPALSPLKLDSISIYRSGVNKASGSALELRTTRKPMLTVAGSSSNIAQFDLGKPNSTIARFDLGRGQVFVLPDAWLFCNYGMAQDDNAILATNLITAHQQTGAVYFDERKHGNDLRPPEKDSVIARLKKPPYSTALWQLLFGALLFWAFIGRRQGSAVALPVSGPVTRASLFAQAMGGLFQKIGRPKAAGAIIGDNFRRRLAKRVGLSPLESDEILARRAHEISGVSYEVVDRLLLQSRAPSNSELSTLRDVQEMERVLQILDGKG